MPTRRDQLADERLLIRIARQAHALGAEGRVDEPRAIDTAAACPAPHVFRAEQLRTLGDRTFDALVRLRCLRRARALVEFVSRHAIDGIDRDVTDIPICGVATVVA